MDKYKKLAATATNVASAGKMEEAASKLAFIFIQYREAQDLFAAAAAENINAQTTGKNRPLPKLRDTFELLNGRNRELMDAIRDFLKYMPEGPDKEQLTEYRRRLQSYQTHTLNPTAKFMGLTNPRFEYKERFGNTSYQNYRTAITFRKIHPTGKLTNPKDFETMISLADFTNLLVRILPPPHSSNIAERFTRLGGRRRRQTHRHIRKTSRK
jgi:hypothetical protein